MNLRFKETPVFSEKGLSVSTLELVDDSFVDDKLHENILVFIRQEVTEAQKERLPDGVRDSEATHLILKMIYDSQPNKKDLFSALFYRSRYQQNQALTDKEVQLFVVSVQTPTQETREKLGYQNQCLAGVYESQKLLLTDVLLISINELSDKPHNAILKCFASEKQERQKAYEILKQSRSELMPARLESLLSGLSKVDGDYTKLTPEQVLEMEQGRAGSP
jgi:hypothetical protein